MTTAAPPGTTAPPEVTLPGSTKSQGIITTLGNGWVLASNAGVLGSGTVASTNTMKANITTPMAGVQQDMLTRLLQSVLISTPAHVTDLQQKLAALTMGGMSVPLPPLNVQQVPLFKTTSDSRMWELNSLVPFPSPLLSLASLSTLMPWSIS